MIDLKKEYLNIDLSLDSADYIEPTQFTLEDLEDLVHILEENLKTYGEIMSVEHNDRLRKMDLDIIERTDEVDLYESIKEEFSEEVDRLSRVYRKAKLLKQLEGEPYDSINNFINTGNY